jgi:hypothetical protein
MPEGKEIAMQSADFSIFCPILFYCSCLIAGHVHQKRFLFAGLPRYSDHRIPGTGKVHRNWMTVVSFKTFLQGPVTGEPA